MRCSIIEHGMMSLSFQSAVQKNEAKLSSFVNYENEMTSQLNKAQLLNVLTVLEHSHIQSDVILCTIL